MQVRSRRILAVSLSTGVVATMLAATGLTSAAYAGPGESGFVAAINAERAQNGLPAYAVAGDLEGMARAQARRMADRLAIYHNPALASEACCWSSLGENVGEGASVDQLVPVFYASPEHRANILSPAFTQVAVGTAVGSDGQLYVDEVFRHPAGTASGAAPATPTTQPTQPKASSTPAPTTTPPTTTPPTTAPPTTAPPTTAPLTKPPTAPAPVTPARTPAASARTAAAHPTLAALALDGAKNTAIGQQGPAGTTDPVTSHPAGASAGAASSQLSGTRSGQAAGASSSTTASDRSDLDRANRSEVRVPLFVLSDAQHSQLVQVLQATPSGADPLASSLRWWRAMDALAG